MGLAAITLTAALSAGAGNSDQTLDETFRLPLESARPWVYMWRSSGLLTPEDTSRHIAEIKDKGFGGFVVYGGEPGSVARKLLPQLLDGCERKGLVMGANNCGSWPSGGAHVSCTNRPWMTVFSVLDVEGGKAFSGKLPEPPLPAEGDSKFKAWLKTNGVATIAVLACRTQGGSAPSKPVITVSSDPAGLPALFDGNWNTSWIPDPVTNAAVRNPWVLFDFGAPRKVDAIWYDSRGVAHVRASDDNSTFKNVFSCPSVLFGGYSEFPATTARYFRVYFSGLNFEKRVYGRVNELALGTRAEVERRALLAAKSGLMPVYWPWTPNEPGFRLKYISAHLFIREDSEFAHQPLTSDPQDRILATRSLVDLTDKVGPDGSLQWDVPPGIWRVVWLRRSIVNSMEFIPDLLNPAASQEDFDKGMSVMGKTAGDKVGNIFRYYHEDNNEIHSTYNWTPAMLEEFRKRRGYEARPYLAALAGQIVDSAEITDRFLSDVRRTVADCVAEHHYGLTRKLATAQGVQFRSEAGGPYYPGSPSHDVMANLSRVDVPVGEFWTHSCAQQNWIKKDGKLVDPTASIWWRYRSHEFAGLPRAGKLLAEFDEGAQNVNVKMAASAAHIYAKPIVDTEAFTSLSHVNEITLSDLLLRANVAFCEGVNRMCFHASDTTAAAEGSPGTVYAAGTYFNDKNTWWPYIGAFNDYIHRCCSLLQRGRFVADLLYYIGDEAPAVIEAKRIREGGRFGYDYDDCNSEALLTRFAVKDGCLVTPEGMRYHVLVLPERRTLTIPVAKKIREFINAGAVVVGPKPLRTPGLSGYPQCDRELKAIADELWDGGKVISGKPEREVLADLKVPVDFAYAGSQPDPLVDFIHRQDGDADIYFVINRRNRTERFEMTFRVTGKAPELWNPLDGVMRDLPEFVCKGGRTTVPVELSAYGGVFVVFRKQTTDHGLRTIDSGSQARPSKEKEKAGGLWRAEPATPRNFPEFKPVVEVTGPWQVQFDPKWGGPEKPVTFESLIDWTSNTVEGIRYYSGTAIYRKVFDFPLPTAHCPLYLDLGVVKDLARVRINGKSCGVAWCPPWRVEISGALKPGVNELEIEVCNTWHNRIQLDQFLPEDKRVVDFGHKLRGDKFKPGPKMPLQPAGLLGPERLMTTE
jgi:hypothetical protein